MFKYKILALSLLLVPFGAFGMRRGIRRLFAEGFKGRSDLVAYWLGFKNYKGNRVDLEKIFSAAFPSVKEYKKNEEAYAICTSEHPISWLFTRKKKKNVTLHRLNAELNVLKSTGDLTRKRLGCLKKNKKHDFSLVTKRAAYACAGFLGLAVNMATMGALEPFLQACEAIFCNVPMITHKLTVHGHVWASNTEPYYSDWSTVATCIQVGLYLPILKLTKNGLGKIPQGFFRFSRARTFDSGQGKALDNLIKSRQEEYKIALAKNKKSEQG